MKIYNTLTKRKGRVYSSGRGKGENVCMRAYGL